MKIPRMLLALILMLAGYAPVSTALAQTADSYSGYSYATDNSGYLYAYTVIEGSMSGICCFTHTYSSWLRITDPNSQPYDSYNSGQAPSDQSASVRNDVAAFLSTDGDYQVTYDNTATCTSPAGSFYDSGQISFSLSIKKTHYLNSGFELITCSTGEQCKKCRYVVDCASGSQTCGAGGYSWGIPVGDICPTRLVVLWLTLALVMTCT